jgi:hypothetical protein
MAQAQTASIGPAAPSPGVFVAKSAGATGLRLTVSGKSFSSREALEIYLAYRAAQETMARGFRWFTFTEQRAKSDKLPSPKADPAGPRYSFRMSYFRPVWRYRAVGSAAWTTWSPFSGSAFPVLDPKSVAAYELSAAIVMRKGMLDDSNPLAFDAFALSDYLINQAETPK